VRFKSKSLLRTQRGLTSEPLWINFGETVLSSLLLLIANLSSA